MYPIEKYKFYTNGNKVIAVSTYAGKTVRGVAKCDNRDEFDLEKGKKLAAARCALKIAKKRQFRAYRKHVEAVFNLDKAYEKVNEANSYLEDSDNALMEVHDYLRNILNEM